MFCTECGREVYDTDGFCRDCGKALQNTLKTKPKEAVDSAQESGDAERAIRKYGIARLAASIGLCFVLFASITATSLVYVLRRTFSEQNITSIMSDIDLVVVLDELGVYDEIADAIAGNTAEEHEELDENDDNEEQLSLLRRMWEDEAIRDYVADNVTGYVDGLLRGDRELGITREDILGFVGRSAGLIQEKIEDRLEEGDEEEAEFYKELEDYIRQVEIPDDYALGIVSSPPTQIDMDLLRLPLMPHTLIVLTVLCVLSLAGLFALNIRHIRKALLGSSVSLLSAGFVCLGFGLLFYNIIWELTRGTLSRALAVSLLSPTRSMTIHISFLLSAAGFLLMVSYVSVAIVKGRFGSGRK